MNSSKCTIAIVTMLGLMTGISPANAQNGDNNFAGPKVGVQAGWERRKIDENVLPAPNSTRLNDKSSGISYGGFVGYDAQFDKFVLGVEADFNPNGKTLNSTVAGGRTVELDSKWAASASARAGITLTPNLLAYGRLGYGFNRHTTRLLTTGNTTPVATNKVTSDGLLYGGGLEYAINRNASLRVEYRHNDYDGSLNSKKVLGGLTLRF